MCNVNQADLSLVVSALREHHKLTEGSVAVAIVFARGETNINRQLARAARLNAEGVPVEELYFGDVKSAAAVFLAALPDSSPRRHFERSQRDSRLHVKGS